MILENDIQIPEPLRKLAERHFVLLNREGTKKKCDTLQIRLSGYTDVAYLMADIIKVCLLALGSDGAQTDAHIPEPDVNISGVLSLLLDMVPYEEAELLDTIREAALSPAQEEEYDWDFEYEAITLTPPVNECPGYGWGTDSV